MIRNPRDRNRKVRPASTRPPHCDFMDTSHRIWHAGLLLLILASSAAVAAAQNPTFTAMYVDGAYQAGGTISEWHTSTSKPKLNGRWLLDPNKHVRWIKNDSPETPVAPKAFVEMFGGDRLPGVVHEYHTGLEQYEERLPAFLTVKPDVVVSVPGQPPKDFLRVKLSTVRRVVWQRRARDHYTPGTLHYLDGREVTFRSLRWTLGGVTLLLKDETRKVSFGDIAELHLPRRDPWDVYFENLAVVPLDMSQRLMRLETFGGLAATCPPTRFQARSVSGEPSGWFHMVQPVWSLDPIWLKHNQVQWRRFFLPSEVPLSQIEPDRAEQISSIGVGWNWQVDRSVRGEPLRSGEKTYGWGFGVPAYCKLEFPLAPLAVKFRTQLGLDEAVGRGGCARGLVFVNKADGQPAFESKTLVGSNEVQDGGTIDLAAVDGGPKLLTLVADPTPADRPPGADPLDIRDMVDWLEPLVELDAGKLKAELTSRIPRTIPSWSGWTLKLNDESQLLYRNVWDYNQPNNGRYRLEYGAKAGPLRLTRTLTLTGQQNFLALLVSRFAQDTAPAEIEVLIAGERAAKFEVKERRAGDIVDAQLVPVSKYQGREVTIELVQTSKSDQGLVEWRGIELLEHTTPTPWITLEPIEVFSNMVDNKRVIQAATKLNVEPFNTIFVEGKVRGHEIYTIVAETDLQNITAIRLEVLPDSRLPGRGPGRESQFMLTDFRVTAAPRDERSMIRPVEFAKAETDYLDPSYGPSEAIDDNDKSGWSTSFKHPGYAHVLIVTTAEDIGYPSGTRLTFTMDQAKYQQSIGKFRLSVTNAPRPVAIERPGVILPKP